MTQMQTAPPVTAPITDQQVLNAAAAWADIQTADGRLVYPGSKLAWLVRSRGAVVAARYLNLRAENLDRTQITGVEDVRLAVENIARLARQGEDMAAADAERDLWEGVLYAAAVGTEEGATLASEALRTRVIPFART